MARVPWRSLGKVVQPGYCWRAVAIYINRLPQLAVELHDGRAAGDVLHHSWHHMIFVTAIYLVGRRAVARPRMVFRGARVRPGIDSVVAGEKCDAYYRDAFCVALFGSAAVLGLNRLPALFSRWPLLRHSLGASRSGRPRPAEPRRRERGFVRGRRFSYRRSPGARSGSDRSRTFAPRGCAPDSCFSTPC